MTKMDSPRQLPSEANAGSTQALRWLFAVHQRERRGLRRYIGPKSVAAGAVFTATLIGTWLLRRHGLFDPALLQNFVRDHAVIAPFVTILVYSLGVLSGLPTLPFNLAAGVFWGPVFGGLISTMGGTLGAVAAFAAARSIFGRPLANRFDSKLITQFQREFEDSGWRFLAFLRLSPAVPTGPVNYIMGLTGIDAFTYIWATLIFLLPSSIAVAFIGSSLGQFVLEGETANTVRLILSISAGASVLAALAYGVHFFRRLRRAKAT